MRRSIESDRKSIDVARVEGHRLIQAEAEERLTRLPHDHSKNIEARRDPFVTRFAN